MNTVQATPPAINIWQIPSATRGDFTPRANAAPAALPRPRPIRKTEGVAGLINLFSKDIFRAETGGVDMLGRVYEYFIGEFANSEGKRGGEYFTPQSIVQTLVAMLADEVF